MTDEGLGRWPIAVEVPVAWGDMDALGHVNNTVYLRWFESARILYFERAGLLAKMGPAGEGPILARQSIDYRRALVYPDVARVEVTVDRFGTTSFNMAFRIHSQRHGALAASGEGLGVMVHYASGRKIVLDEAFKAAVLALEAGRR